MTARDRMRRYRERRRRDKIVLPPLEVPRRLLEELIDAGMLPDNVMNDRAKLAEIVTKFLSSLRPSK